MKTWIFKNIASGQSIDVHAETVDDAEDILHSISYKWDAVYSKEAERKTQNYKRFINFALGLMLGSVINCAALISIALIHLPDVDTTISMVLDMLLFTALLTVCILIIDTVLHD